MVGVARRGGGLKPGVQPSHQRRVGFGVGASGGGGIGEGGKSCDGRYRAHDLAGSHVVCLAYVLSLRGPDARTVGQCDRRGELKLQSARGHERGTGGNDGPGSPREGHGRGRLGSRLAVQAELGGAQVDVSAAALVHVGHGHQRVHALVAFPDLHGHRREHIVEEGSLPGVQIGIHAGYNGGFDGLGGNVFKHLRSPRFPRKWC
ncbi:hypothetical protein SDC9_57897 [bioreactor metagenome]|uniref:Uncharacterized protein n=1 Tax=bioreactor metagenome TaxID=1076179 RepID=A0A644X6W5_9ZZZZ